MNEALWRIGDPALGPDQFCTSSQVEVFVVGESDPSRDWPGRLPGPLDAHGGWREHSATIRFHLDDGIAGRLRLGVQTDRGPCPELRVTVNGTSGLFYPEAVLSDRSQVSPLGLAGGAGVLDIALPADLLVAGSNEIILTTVATEMPEERKRHRGQFGHLFGSLLCWTFLELVPAAYDSEATLRLRPLPFYETRPDGLYELVDLYLTSPLPETVTVAGQQLGVPAETFGQARLRFGLPEFAEPRSVSVEVDGRVSEHLLTPCRKWTMHLIPHVHLDLGYTDYQGKVIELHSRNLERALDILGDTPDYRFMVDGSYILDNYLRSRPPGSATKVLDAVRDGALSVNAYYALFLTGLASLEECCRATYLSARLSDEHDFPITYANLTDVPSYTHAIPSLLKAAGIDAFLGIQNHTRGGNADSDAVHFSSPYMWEGPDGAEVLTFFSDCYNQLRFLAADPPTTTGLAETLPRFLESYDRPDYLPHDLPIVGIHTDNEDLADGEAKFVAEWNSRYAYPRLRWSTPADYFDAVKPLAAELPRWKGDGGSYWEDGAGTAAVIVARYRDAQTLLPVAESVQALVGGPSTAARDDLDRAWEHLLIGCEHTWTSTHASVHPHSQQAIDQLAWKRHHVESAFRMATDETRRGLSQLAEQLSLPGPCLVVYNAASWPRGGQVTVEVLRDLTVTDETGRELPAEREAVDGFDLLRLTVPEVPAFGYRVLPIATRTTSADTPPQDLPARLETDHWVLDADPATGRVTGLRHRASGRQVIDPTRNRHGWALGELLYVTGGGERTSLHDTKLPLPLPDLSIEPAKLGQPELVRIPGGWLIRATGHGQSIPYVRSEVRLYDDTERIDVEVSVKKEDVLAKESVYIAFPFTIDAGSVRFDRHLGWVDPAVDHTTGACNEWFTASNVVAVTGSEGTVLWSSPDTPLFAVGDVVRGRWPTSFVPDSTLLSWAMNNYWFTNTPASQSGELTMRYSFTLLQTWDPVAAARFGREVRTPLIAGELAPNDKFLPESGTLTGPTGSLFPLQLPDNVAGTVHRGRSGLILRLQELAGEPATVRLDRPAELCTTDERSVGPVPNSTVNLPANGLITLRIEERLSRES